MAFITGTFIKVKLACHKMTKEYRFKEHEGEGPIQPSWISFRFNPTPREFALSEENLHCQIVFYLVNKHC